MSHSCSSHRRSAAAAQVIGVLDVLAIQRHREELARDQEIDLQVFLGGINCNVHLERRAYRGMHIIPTVQDLIYA